MARNVGVEDAAVLAENGAVLLGHGPAFRNGLESPQFVVNFLGRVDVRDRQHRQLVFRVAEHAADRGVDADDTLRLDVGNQQAVNDPVVDRLEMIAALARASSARFSSLMSVNTVAMRNGSPFSSRIIDGVLQDRRGLALWGHQDVPALPSPVSEQGRDDLRVPLAGIVRREVVRDVLPDDIFRSAAADDMAERGIDEDDPAIRAGNAETLSRGLGEPLKHLEPLVGSRQLRGPLLDPPLEFAAGLPRASSARLRCGDVDVEAEDTRRTALPGESAQLHCGSNGFRRQGCTRCISRSSHPRGLDER